MSSLRLIGSVGEPINPEAYMWYRENIGGDRCPVVDTWWQTETGSIMISPLPGVTSGKPGSAMTPIPGVARQRRGRRAARPSRTGSGGYLVLDRAVAVDAAHDLGRRRALHDTYWSRFQGVYFAGDGAKLDEDGDIWLLGRVDDVMNVSGHRLSTTEIESALVSHPEGGRGGGRRRQRRDERAGHRRVRHPARGAPATAVEDVVKELRDHVANEIGAIAKPKSIMVVPELPKTRSGKIMRRLLRDVAENRDVVTSRRSPTRPSWT